MFSNNVTLEALRVQKLGTWEQSARSPAPPMELLMLAEVWESSKYAGLRETLARRAARPARRATTNAEKLRCLDFPDCHPPEGPQASQSSGAMMARMFVYQPEKDVPVPDQALACVVRLAVVMAPQDEETLEPCAQVREIAGRAVVALCGEPATVRRMTNLLRADHPERLQTEVEVWRRHRQTGVGGNRSRLRRWLLVLLHGPEDLVEQEVCV